MLTHALRQPQSSLIFDVSQKSLPPRMAKNPQQEKSSRFVILALFITSLVACYFVADFLKDSITAAYAIHQSPRVLRVHIDEYLGEKRHRYRKSTSILHEYRGSGDGRMWHLRLPDQVSIGSSVEITYAASDPSTFVVGRHLSFISAFSKMSGGVFGLIFLGGCFAGTALFGYGVYDEFFTKQGATNRHSQRR